MSSEQHQDKALERLLRQSFRTRTDKPGSGSCLDAEMLASWADGTLPANDLAAAEAHASSCDRCLALLAAMERATPPVAVSKRWWSYGPMSRERRGAMGPRKRAAWSRRWGPATKQTFRWLVPLTAAVTVVAVWIAVARDQRPIGSEQMAEQIATPNTGSTVAPGASGAKRPRPERGAGGERVEGAPPSESERGWGPASVEKSAAGARGAEGLPAEARSAKAGARGMAGGVIAGSAGGAADVSADSAVVAPPGANAEVPRPQAGPTDASRARELEASVTTRQELGASPAPSKADEQSARKESAPAREPPVPLSAPAAITVSETIQTSAAISLARRAPIQIISPNRLIRWRATGGFVERSADGGTTWTATSAQLPVDLTAGVSPSPSVVWLVGSAGTVLLSTDGMQFRVVPFPERIDLTAVRATDARTATVTTSDRRTFATADGGVTWLAKP